MREGSQLTQAGRMAAVVLAGCGVGTLVVDHPWPRLLAAFLGSLFLLSWWLRGATQGLRFDHLAPARTSEGMRVTLALRARLRGRLPLWVGRLRATAGEVHIPHQVVAVARGRDLVQVEVRAHARGRARRLRLEWDHSLPFGLLRHSGSSAVDCDLWVFPSPRQLRESVLEEMLSLRPRGSDLPQPVGPGEAEFYGLREWREGDHERRVNPRASARRGRKVLQVFRGEAPPHVQLVLDLRLGVGGEDFGGAEFEEAVRFVAGVVRSVLRRSVPISLWFHGDGELREAVADQTRELGFFLAALALAQPVHLHEPEESAVLPEVAGRGVLVHLGAWKEEVPSPRWRFLRAGSREFFRLQQPWECGVVQGESE